MPPKKPRPLKIAALFLLLPIVCVYGWYQGREMAFNRDCKAHLKRAADATSVDLAKQELRTALDYIEAHGMTYGYATLFYYTPENDLRFWHQNLEQAWTDLTSLPKDATELERSNMLLKLRETILDHDKDGETVTSPGKAFLHPHISIFAWFLCIFGALGLLGGYYAFKSFVSLRQDRLTLPQTLIGTGILLTGFLIPMLLVLFA